MVNDRQDHTSTRTLFKPNPVVKMPEDEFETECHRTPPTVPVPNMFFTVICLCSGQTGQVLSTDFTSCPGLGRLAQAHFPEKEPSLPQSGVGGPMWSLNHAHQSSVDNKQCVSSEKLTTAIGFGATIF